MSYQGSKTNGVFSHSYSQQPINPKQSKSFHTQKTKTSYVRITSSIKNQKDSDNNKNSSESDFSHSETPTDAKLSLKDIKTKEQIEEESKESEKILLSLNSNIDDLFSKISSLTDQVQNHLSDREIRTVPIREPTNFSLLKSKQENNAEGKQSSNLKGKAGQIEPIPIDRQLQQPLSEKKVAQYLPIFFQNLQQNRNLDSNGLSMRMFNIGSSVGLGKFGQVVQCKDKASGALYALKKIFKSVIEECQMHDQLLTELSILSRVDHPNLVKGFASFTDDYHIFILTEYIQGDTLAKRLLCPQTYVKKIIKQVLEALKYLQQIGVTHRDIKPQNILVTQDGTVKICDFGWASVQQKMDTVCGTLEYVTPQMASNQTYSRSTDLWNVGVLTYELLFGVAPFQGKSRSEVFPLVRQGTIKYPPQIKISRQGQNFIQGLLKPQKQRKCLRWSLNHQFLSVEEAESTNKNKVETLENDIKKILT